MRRKDRINALLGELPDDIGRLPEVPDADEYIQDGLLPYLKGTTPIDWPELEPTEHPDRGMGAKPLGLADM